MTLQDITLSLTSLLILVSIIFCIKSIFYRNYKIQVFMYFGLDKKIRLNSVGNSLEGVKLDIENTISTNIENIIKVQDSLIPYLIEVHLKNEDCHKRVYYSREISKFLMSNEYLSVLEKNIKNTKNVISKGAKR